MVGGQEKGGGGLLTGRLFVGVGIDRYIHFEDLGQAVSEVEGMAELLGGERGFEPVVFRNMTDDEAADRLREALPIGRLPHGHLVVVWAGHGEPSEEGQLRLITGDAQRGDTPTRTPEEVAGRAARSGASQVLLIFDTCFAGGGVIDAARVVSRLRANLPDPKPLWVGVLASAQEHQKARDGVFFSELRRILTEGPRDAALRTRFHAFNQGVRGDDVIDAVVQEWTVSGQCPEVLSMGRPTVMFPNPLYDPAAPEGIVEHLFLSGQGRGPGEPEGSYFTGRTDQLSSIVKWMGLAHPGVLVITGPAGSGKSAITGRIVGLSDRSERQTLRVAGEIYPDPGEGSVQAHVHARGLTASLVTELIDEQLCRRGVLPSLPYHRNSYELLGALERISELPTLVIDGLDEAESEAWPIVEELIQPLGRLARVLVATREMARGNGPTLIATIAPNSSIDLGDPGCAKQTLADVRAYVRKRLAEIPGR